MSLRDERIAFTFLGHLAPAEVALGLDEVVTLTLFTSPPADLGQLVVDGTCHALEELGVVTLLLHQGIVVRSNGDLGLTFEGLRTDDNRLVRAGAAIGHGDDHGLASSEGELVEKHVAQTESGLGLGAKGLHC